MQRFNTRWILATLAIAFTLATASMNATAQHYGYGHAYGHGGHSGGFGVHHSFGFRHHGRGPRHGHHGARHGFRFGHHGRYPHRSGYPLRGRAHRGRAHYGVRAGTGRGHHDGDCESVYKRDHIEGRPAVIQGLRCYDEHGQAYIVPESREIVGYDDDGYRRD